MLPFIDSDKHWGSPDDFILANLDGLLFLMTNVQNPIHLAYQDGAGTTVQGVTMESIMEISSQFEGPCSSVQIRSIEQQPEPSGEIRYRKIMKTISPVSLLLVVVPGDRKRRSIRKS